MAVNNVLTSTGLTCIQESTKRIIARWIHIISAFPLVGHIYGPQAETQQYLPFFRYLYFPVVVVSGLWTW